MEAHLLRKKSAIGQIDSLFRQGSHRRASSELLQLQNERAALNIRSQAGLGRIWFQIGDLMLRALILALLLVQACSTHLTSSETLVSVTPYKLAPGDELKITVFGEDNISGDYIVDRSGISCSRLSASSKRAGAPRLNSRTRWRRPFPTDSS